jgi:hypothetical protein
MTCREGELPPGSYMCTVDGVDLGRMVRDKRHNVKRIMFGERYGRSAVSGTVRAFDLAELASWLEEHKGCLVRRARGDMVYTVLGSYHDSARGQENIELRRLDGTLTWAPASEKDKFIKCNRKGGTVSAQTITPEDIVEGIARANSVETLTKALDRRVEIEADVRERAAQQAANQARDREIREAAIAALEKAASKGDVGAANSLLDLTS